jgi:hypothetical protein
VLTFQNILVQLSLLSKAVNKNMYLATTLIVTTCITIQFGELKSSNDGNLPN